LIIAEFMQKSLKVSILPQPDEESCGATCLHAVYQFFQYQVPLAEVVGSVVKIDSGGTLIPFLGQHALAQGFASTIVPFDVRVFDPSWKRCSPKDLRDRLLQSAERRPDAKTSLAVRAYAEFLSAGGEIRFDEPRCELLQDYLLKGFPIISGVSATYLYQSKRETEELGDIGYNDLLGQPRGHFVVIEGFDGKMDTVSVADPQYRNPRSPGCQHLDYPCPHFLNSVLMGSITFDAAFLIVQPRSR
jgi:hypothetical protein